MEMIGQSVTHKTLGIGTVENVNGRYLSIRFGAALKTFVYPDTFGKFLTANDPAFAAQIERDLDAGRNEKAKNEARRREEARYFSQGIVIPGRRQSEEEAQSFTWTLEKSEMIHMHILSTGTASPIRLRGRSGKCSRP